MSDEKTTDIPSESLPQYLGAIDQGTSSSRFILFDLQGNKCFSHQVPLQSKHPHDGWNEQDPDEILQTVVTCIDRVLGDNDIATEQVLGVGITNQRETTVVWDRETGKPLHNAIVWNDVRTARVVRRLTSEFRSFVDVTGLPFSTYFSAVKLLWLMENCEAVQKAIKDERAMFGTVDSWLVYKLTGEHITDVTNASRTLLMDLRDCSWSADICKKLGIPMGILPTIRSSAERYGVIKDGPGRGLVLSGVVGDQQAAMLGHLCLHPGMSKNTYGTGCFMLMSTGSHVVPSSHGLLSTALFQLGPKQPVQYALEGSVAACGIAVQYALRTGIASDVKELNKLAESVEDTAGAYFVPAFSGLLSPYWDPNARGLMIGLSQRTERSHLARAVLSCIPLQTWTVLDAMNRDLVAVTDSEPEQSSGPNVRSSRRGSLPLVQLHVDGGVSQSDLMCQIQADLLRVPVVRPRMVEKTALGAALAAGLGVGLWNGLPRDMEAAFQRRSRSPQDAEDSQKQPSTDSGEEDESGKDSLEKDSGVDRFEAKMSESHARHMINGFLKAVRRSLAWAEFDPEGNSVHRRPSDDGPEDPMDMKQWE